MDFPSVGVTPDMGTAWFLERYCNKKNESPPSMGRQCTSTRYGVWCLIFGAFRSVSILRSAYFLKYLRTYGRNVLRFVITYSEIKMESLLYELDRGKSQTLSPFSEIFSSRVTEICDTRTR